MTLLASAPPPAHASSCPLGTEVPAAPRAAKAKAAKAKAAKAKAKAAKARAAKARAGKGKAAKARAKARGRRKAKVRKARVRKSKLTPRQPGTIVNFGGGHGAKEIDVVMTAVPAIKRPFHPEKLEIYVPRRFPRQGEKLESLLFERPTYSPPQLHENGTRLTFTVCLDAKDAGAGSYIGEVAVSGPPVAGSATVAVVANVKNRDWFRVGLGFALLGAFLLLLYRPMQEHPHKRDWLRATFGSPVWWFETVASLVAATVAALSIYSQDPAWGSDAATAVVGLIGAAFAAAGVKSLIGSVGPTDPRKL